MASASTAAMAVCCILMYTVSVLCGKLFSMRYTGNPRAATPVFAGIYGCVVGALAWAVYSGFRFSASPQTWLLGVSCGVTIFLYHLGLINASRTGPYSLQSIFMYSGNVLIPLAFSVLCWGDRLKWAQLAGIALMLVSFVLINKNGAPGAVRGKMYYLWILLLFATNGAVGVINDAQQRIMLRTERCEMIVITYLSSALVSFAYLLITCKKDSLRAFRMPLKPWLCVLGSSATVVLAVYLLMTLLGKMNSSILYAILNGSVLVLSVVLSAKLFHEKLQKSVFAGIVTVVISLVLLSL